MDEVVEVSFDLHTTGGKMALAEACLEKEQQEISTIHRFGGGLYIREAHYPKGTLVVGLEHVSEHMNVLLKGSLRVIDGDGSEQTLTAPYMFVAKAGSKVGLTLEDVVWQNIYVANSTDVEYLESILFVIPDKLKEHQIYCK